MDNDMFESYEFKPSDVIEGLNRYFAETKAKRYLRAPLKIRNGVWTSNPFCNGNPDSRKDIIFTNSPPDRNTKSGHVCWNYYLICDPEEVVGVAINWLREEHDIFYTPGMEVPKEDCDIFCMENLDVVPVAKVRDALGIVDEYVDILGSIRKLREERDELKEKYERLYISYEKTYRAKFTKLSEERDRYKWLYENLKNGMESVLQEAKERED